MRICCLRFQYKIYCLRGSVLMLFNILTLSISLLALISSFFIGKKQFELSKMQAAAQNKVELYLLCQPITLKDMDGRQPDKMVPSVSIINIGNNVIYLDKYSFNGREYPLGKEVLPPCISIQRNTLYHFAQRWDNACITRNWFLWLAKQALENKRLCWSSKRDMGNNLFSMRANDIRGLSFVTLFW